MLNRVFFSSAGVIERTTSYALYPLFKMRECFVFPFNKASLYFQTVSELEKKVITLEQQRDDLRAELIELEALATFNRDSLDIQEFAQRYDYQQQHLAKILLYEISEKEDVIFVEAGLNKSIQKDDVVVYKNMLIGRVIEVYPWYSKVALITDQRCKVSAQCKKGVAGICCGKNKRQLELQFVPHFKDIKLEDRLISTGKGLIYPQGFDLGTVVDIVSDNVSHYIQVSPNIDIQKIEYVYILRL